MDDEERQYWFDIMPSMTKEQTDRLFNILETERKKLEALDLKYKEEIQQLINSKIPSKEFYYFEYLSGGILSLGDNNNSKNVIEAINGINDEDIKNNLLSIHKFIDDFLRKPKVYFERYGESRLYKFFDNYAEYCIATKNTYKLNELINCYQKGKYSPRTYRILNIVYQKISNNYPKIIKSDIQELEEFLNFLKSKEPQIQNEPERPNQVKIAFKLFDLLLASEDINTCEADIKKLKKLCLEFINMKDKTTGLPKSNLETELILIDIALSSGKLNFDRTTKENIQRQLKKISTNRNYFRKSDNNTAQYYYELNKAYFNNDFNKFYRKVQEYKKKQKKSQDVEADLLEYVTYYIFALIHNDKHEKAKQQLLNVTYIGHAMDTKAGGYLERALLEIVAIPLLNLKEGYKNGLSKGFIDGNISGFQMGKTQGYREGNRSGYNDGKKLGFKEGNKSGYEAGVSQKIQDIKELLLGYKLAISIISIGIIFIFITFVFFPNKIRQGNQFICNILDILHTNFLFKLLITKYLIYISKKRKQITIRNHIHNAEEYLNTYPQHIPIFFTREFVYSNQKDIFSYIHLGCIPRILANHNVDKFLFLLQSENQDLKYTLHELFMHSTIVVLKDIRQNK